MEHGEIIKENINSLEQQGDQETLIAIKKHLDEALARMQESKERGDRQVVEAGGSVETLNEKTSEVDQKISEVTASLENEEGLSNEEKIKRLLSIPEIADRFIFEYTDSSEEMMKILSNEQFTNSDRYNKALAALSSKDFVAPEKIEKTEAPIRWGRSESERGDPNDDFSVRKMLVEKVPYMGVFGFDEPLADIVKFLKDASAQGIQEKTDVLNQLRQAIDISQYE